MCLEVLNDFEKVEIGMRIRPGVQVKQCREHEVALADACAMMQNLKL